MPFGNNEKSSGVVYRRKPKFGPSMRPFWQSPEVILAIGTVDGRFQNVVPLQNGARTVLRRSQNPSEVHGEVCGVPHIYIHMRVCRSVRWAWYSPFLFL